MGKIFIFNTKSGIITELKVKTGELINEINKYDSRYRKAMKDLGKNEFDRQRLEENSYRLAKTSTTKYEIDEYVSGIIIAKNQEAPSIGIKIDLNEFSVRWGMIDQFQYEAVGYQKVFCTSSVAKKSYLDYWWAVILILAITFFIFTQSGRRLKEIKGKSVKSPFLSNFFKSSSNKSVSMKKKVENNFVIDFWNGRISLGTSFWAVYFIGGTIVSLPAFLLSETTNLIIFFVIFQFIYLIWAIVGTWKSASKYKPKKNQWSWGTIAQIYIVLSALRILLNFFKALY